MSARTRLTKIADFNYLSYLLTYLQHYFFLFYITLKNKKEYSEFSVLGEKKMLKISLSVLEEQRFEWRLITDKQSFIFWHFPFT